MTRTGIQWTWREGPAGLVPDSGFTWNPLVGCRRISPGCQNCYAERLLATRLRSHPVYQGLAVMRKTGPRFTGEHRIVADRLDEPLRKKSAKGCKVFVNDLGDLFFEGHTFEQIAAVYGVMAACPEITFQVLTKRIDRALAWYAWVGSTAEHPLSVIAGEGARLAPGWKPLNSGELHWPLPNVWLGVSIEDQQRADERVPKLLKLPAAVRFLSCEPLLEDVDWRAGRGISWVIVGGESGPDARPFDLAWARSILAQCKDAGVACFVKQLGAKPFEMRRDPTYVDEREDEESIALADSHGGDPEEWPVDLRIRQFPKLMPRSA